MKPITKQSSNTEDNNLPDEIEDSLKKLETKLKAEFPFGVPRNKIAEATGYILHPRTCANEDSLGTGIPERCLLGRNTVYMIPGVMKKVRSKITLPLKRRMSQWQLSS